MTRRRAALLARTALVVSAALAATAAPGGSATAVGAAADPDVTPPTTKVTSGPQPTFRTTVTFRFVSDDPGATFECRLKDVVRSPAALPYRPCSTPRTYHGLEPGRYKFQARAVDAAGNRDRTPAYWKFTVKKRR